MAIDKVIGVDVTTDSTILGISGLDKVNGFELVSGGVPAPTDYILQWRFNGNGDDTSAGGANDAAFAGTEAYGVGQDTVASHAASLNGASYVSRPGFGNFTSEDFSFSFWVFVNTGALSVDPVLVWKGAYQTSGYYGGLQADGSIYFRTEQSGAGQQSNTAAAAVTENAWYNIAVTRAGAAVKIYVNGSNATSVSGTHVNPADASANTFALGAYIAGVTNYLTGRVDDFRVYDYVLTSGQALAITLAGAE